MNPNEETTTMLQHLHEEIREAFECHIPDSYAKRDAMFDLDSAFENANDAIRECSL